MIQEITVMDENFKQQLAVLGEKFYPLMNLRGKFHADTFAHFWSKYLEMGLGKIFAHVIDGKIAGAMGVLISMSPVDGQTLIEESFWFVDPDHRGTAGIKLFRAAEEWAKQSGASRMLVGYLCGSMPGKVENFYERCGYRKLQIQFVREL